MAKKTEGETLADARAAEPKQWDTTVKLGAIEEANYAAIGAVVVAVDRATGELTLRAPAETQPHGRSREVVSG